jgi:protein TonB
MAYADQMPGSRRAATIAGVAAAHLLIGYVFMSGMAVEMARTVTRTLEVTNIAVEPPPPPIETPPPPKAAERVVTNPTPRVEVARVDPIVTVPAPGPVIVTSVEPQPPIVAPMSPVYEQPVQPPAVASRAAGVRVKGDKGSWISNDDYPSSALRAGEQGVVGISMSVDAEGRVTSCSVTSSSGSSALDQATCRLYPRKARFVPARDDAGRAIASTYVDRVRWQLPRD